MKGIVLKPFESLRGQHRMHYREGQVIEITDWSWVTGRLVRPISSARPAPETAIQQPQERTILIAKHGGKYVKA
jgi:hypothetical protein